MPSIKVRPRSKLTNMVIISVLCVGLLFTNHASISAQATPHDVQKVRVLYLSDWGLLHGAALTYSSSLQQFFLLAPNEQTSEATLSVLTAYGTKLYSRDLNLTIGSSTQIAFDESTSSLYLFNPIASELLRIGMDANQQLDWANATHTDLSQIGRIDGMALDTQSHTLYLLSNSKQQLLALPLTASGVEVANMQSLDLSHLQGGLHGLALHPTSHHLFTLRPSQNAILEIAPTGELLDTYQTDALALTSARQLVFAPSTDQTDPEETLHLFMIDSKNPNEIDAANRLFLPLISQANTANTNQAEISQETLGEMLELSLDAAELPVSVASVNATNLQLIRTINTAAFQPPSPDPSGLTYLADRNTLLMSDGEVEETVNGRSVFAGANIWEMTLGGSVVRSANLSTRAPTSSPMTNEPTGTAWNPNNGHYYFSDDDALKVYDLNPGRDGQIGTGDDSWSSFGVSSYSSNDPEGITYDTWNNRIFIVDGSNAEIYQLTTWGSLIAHFDVQRYGVVDPESVEFNNATGTLFVLSNAGNPIIIETTTSGTLLQTFNIAAANAVAPAGLAYAPASDGSGQMRFYIADRRVDNNSDSRENDGRIYEMSAPQAGSAATATPIRSTATAIATPNPTNQPATPVPTAGTPASGKVSITIIEQSNPASSQDFTFYSAFGTFALDNATPDDGDGVASTIQFSNRDPGSYNISQAAQSGWKLNSIQCAPTGKSVINLAQNNVAISATAGDAITCTFVNQSTSATPQATTTRQPTATSQSSTPTKTPTPSRTSVSATVIATPMPDASKASITIVEQAQPNSPQNFDFYSAFGAFSFDSAVPDDQDGVSASITFPSVNPGSYNISQVIQGNWKLNEIRCTPSTNTSVTLADKNVAITARAGDVITCTFVNSSN